MNRKNDHSVSILDNNSTNSIKKIELNAPFTKYNPANLDYALNYLVRNYHLLN